LERALKTAILTAIGIVILLVAAVQGALEPHSKRHEALVTARARVLVHRALRYDISEPLAEMQAPDDEAALADCEGAACGTSPGESAAEVNATQGQRPEEAIPAPTPPPVLSPAGIAIEQTSPGSRAEVPLIESFDGLGAGFTGPQGTANLRNPSDNSLAAGPNHIVQIVNSRIAIYSKRGKKYDKSGTVLYGAVTTKSVWTGFGGVCEARNNGDAVVRYDQLAGRWVIIMPIFSRIGPEDFPRKTGLQPREPVPAGQLAKSGEASSPGAAAGFPRIRRNRRLLRSAGKGRRRKKREYSPCATR
jgi:hypothetical protein